MSFRLIPNAYRALLRDRRARRLLSGLGVSSLGDGMSIVTIAWLAVETAPAGHVGLFVGLAIAAYTLPGAVGALALGRYLRHRPARALVLGHCLLRAVFLGAIVALLAAGALTPSAYVALLAGSSLLASWGNAGEYTMLAELGGEEGRLAANSLASAQVWLATIVGPVTAASSPPASQPAGCSPSTPPRSPFSASRPGVRTPPLRRPRSRSIRERPNPAFASSVVTASSACSSSRGCSSSSTGLSRTPFRSMSTTSMQMPDCSASTGTTSSGVGALASTLVTGMLRGRATRRVVLLIVAGWGACLLPFAFAPVAVTLVCFALGGLVDGPFIPLTYALFQSITTTANLPSVLAARSAAVTVATPLGTGNRRPDRGQPRRR